MRHPSKGIFKMPQVFEPRIGHDPVLAIASQRGNQRMYSNWMSQFPSGSNYGGRLAQLQLRFRIPLRMRRSPAWTLQMMKHCVMQCLLFELYDMIPEELSYQKTKRKVKAKVKAKAKTQTTPTPSQDPTGASGYASSADSEVEMDPGVPYDHGSLVLPKAPPKAWIARQLGAPPPAPKSATASSTGTGQAIGPKAKAKARGQDAMMLWYGAAPATKAPPEEHGDPQRDFDPPGAPYPVHPSWAPNLVANWPCHCGLEDLSVKRICLFLSTLRLLRCLMQDARRLAAIGERIPLKFFNVILKLTFYQFSTCPLSRVEDRCCLGELQQMLPVHGFCTGVESLEPTDLSTYHPSTAAQPAQLVVREMMAQLPRGSACGF